MDEPSLRKKQRKGVQLGASLSRSLSVSASFERLVDANQPLPLSRQLALRQYDQSQACANFLYLAKAGPQPFQQFSPPGCLYLLSQIRNRGAFE